MSNIQKVEGLCEAVKICFADGGDTFFDYLELGSADTLFTNKETLGAMIYLVLGTKKKFIEEDEFDQGVRLLLNFGHTFGHALEGASNYSISHGIAVGVGMLASFMLSEKLGFVENQNRRARVLIAYILRLFSHVQNVESLLSALDWQRFKSCFCSDKKHTHTHFVMILFNQEGLLVRKKLDRTDALEEKIAEVFQCLQRGLYEI